MFKNLLITYIVYTWQLVTQDQTRNYFKRCDSKAPDAILTDDERSVANVDAMKYKCWLTKIS